MKKFIYLFLFILILGTVYPKTNLRRITKLEYNKNNNLIKIVEFNQNKSKIHTIEYIYDDENRILRYVNNGKIQVRFDYNPQGRIKKIVSFYDIYELNYENGVIRSYDLINDMPNGGRYFSFSKEPVLNINPYQFFRFSVVKNGKINVSKVTSETFGYSNQSTEVIKNKHGEIIKKIWGNKKDNEYHVKYFSYDYNGNLIEVKAVNKVKIIPSVIEFVLYFFAIMFGGYSN